jgi:hypothetical protein
MIVFWVMLSLSAKLFLLALLGTAIAPIIRAATLVKRLYKSSNQQVSVDDVLNVALSEELLAMGALGNRLGIGLEAAISSASVTVERTTRGRPLQLLQLADNRFQYLWERCSKDVESTRRASHITVLLSCTMLTYCAFPTYLYFYNNGNRTGLASLLLTTEQLGTLLAIGLSISTVLYFMSSFFRRALNDRMATWKYIRTRLQIELSRDE